MGPFKPSMTASKDIMPSLVSRSRVEADPGRRSRSGFTLIELLIVVVIIGILVAIAIPKFSFTKHATYISRMKADLRNLATAQEAYITDNGTYYSGSIPSAALVYNPSQGVAVTLASADSAGWGATAAYPGQTTSTCALFVGSASPVAPATVEGQIACTP